MERTKSDVIRTITTNYIERTLELIAEDVDFRVEPTVIESELISNMRNEFSNENMANGREGVNKWVAPQNLSPAQIAEIISSVYPVATISCSDADSDEELDLLAIYQDYGPNEGIYVTKESIFRSLAKEFYYNITDKDFKEVMINIRHNCKRVTRNENRDLIAVNNGVFNYKTKELLDFDPEYVFMSKSKIDYKDSPINPIIDHPTDGPWDVESWIKDFYDDDEMVNLIWEILGAVIRPNVSWNKAAWFYSEQGNNGKGTLCSLMRNLCGKGSYASIPISDFGKDFLLEPIIQASSIIVDENNVGTFVDQAANLKAIITNDVIQINRKYKTPIAFRFRGFMIQCLNEFPRIKDKSDSFARRQLIVPFIKCFTGAEKRYIKDDYLQRTEVLEYVLHRVLNMNYYVLSEPDMCTNSLSQYREYNDPIRQFFTEVEDKLVWDAVPFKFLYDLYKAWFKENSPSGSMSGIASFNKDLVQVVTKSSKWETSGTDKTIRMAPMMTKPEPLIMEYDLTKWKSNYKGNNVDKICTPENLASAYRGIRRM